MRLNGMRPAYRADHLKLKGLSNGAYRLHQIYIDLTVWDKGYSSYGSVKESDSRIAKFFLCRNKSTISVYRRELLVKGFIKVEKGKVKVTGVEERFLVTSSIAQKRVKEGLEFGEYDQAVENIQPVSLENTNTQPPETPQPRDPIVEEALIAFNGELSFNPATPPVSSISSPMDKRRKLIMGGFYPESLDEPCFCQSGKRLIDCCAIDVYESLKGIRD